MIRDALGLSLTTHSNAAAAAFDHAVEGYVTYRADGAARLAALLQADPDFALAHVLMCYFMLLLYKQALVPVARVAAATAARLMPGATPREQAHLAALEAWIADAPDRAAAIWQRIVGQHPRETACHSRRSQHSLAMEGLNLMFERQGKPPIAPLNA